MDVITVKGVVGSFDVLCGESKELLGKISVTCQYNDNSDIKLETKYFDTDEEADDYIKEIRKNNG